MKKLLCVLSALCATLLLSSCFLIENLLSSPNDTATESSQLSSSVTESSPNKNSSEVNSFFSESVKNESSENETSESQESSSLQESSENTPEASSEEESSSEESSENAPSLSESVETGSSEEDLDTPPASTDVSEDMSSPDDDSDSPFSPDDEEGDESTSSPNEEIGNETSSSPEDLDSPSPEESWEDDDLTSVPPEESTSEDISEGGSSSVDSSVEDSVDEEEPEEPTYTYNDFTVEEKRLFILYVGEVLPFPATNEYFFEGYYSQTDYENGINFYTAGNTQTDFNAYLRLLRANGYTRDKMTMDDKGNAEYTYKKEDITALVSYYANQGEINVTVYSKLSDGVVKEYGTQTVDFTKAKNVQDTTDLAYYLDGCPTTGSPAVLVIPIEFSDVTAKSKGYSIDKIKAAFMPNGKADYCSVYDYYYTSSYGELTLDITVLDSWFKPKYTSSYYMKKTMYYYGTQTAIGDQIIMDEALAWLASRMDLSKFDSDNNSIIDSIVLIPTLDVNSDVDMQWAYRYWNIYTNSNNYYYEYDGVSANDYMWAPYQFMHEGIDRNGNYAYTFTSAINTYTFIHEFGHVLGADDYYDTAYVDHPMSGYDIMDAMIGDHNPYTKFNYGWLTTSRLVVAEDTTTLVLEDFSKNGDTIIIANNWNNDLGAYQEYYVLMYYTNTGLNSGDYGYFLQEGILVYHVNAVLESEKEGKETYYYIANSNTHASDKDYGTKDNLIEFVLSEEGSYVYREGDCISAETKDDNGKKIAYTFTVNELSDTEAIITFEKNT